MKPSGDKPETTPEPADMTARTALRTMLEDEEWDFDSLRRMFGMKPKTLEAELLHLEKSIKSLGGRIVVRPAQCLACDYAFEIKKSRPMHAPRRCPACRKERVEPPTFRIEVPDAD